MIIKLLILFHSQLGWTSHCKGCIVLDVNMRSWGRSINVIITMTDLQKSKYNKQWITVQEKQWRKQVLLRPSVSFGRYCTMEWHTHTLKLHHSCTSGNTRGPDPTQTRSGVQTFASITIPNNKSRLKSRMQNILFCKPAKQLMNDQPQLPLLTDHCFVMVIQHPDYISTCCTYFYIN